MRIEETPMARVNNRLRRKSTVIKWTPACAVECLDTGQRWPSLKSASADLGCTPETLKKYINQGKAYDQLMYRKVEDVGDG
jgi:hypothetical protein